MKNETEVRRIVADAEWLGSHVKSIALVIAGIRRILYRNIPSEIESSYDNYYIDGETVTAQFSEYVCGSTNNGSLDFPVAYLWDADYEATEVAAYAERNRLADLRAHLDKISADRVFEEQQRAEYERLHAKFGPKDCIGH